MSLKINIGCGKTPTKGWKNYDNSWSVRLSNKPILVFLLKKLGLLSKAQSKFIVFAGQENILWANAIERIPEKDEAADVIYSSHMIEHIDRQEVALFFKEAIRVLKSGGIIRIAVPDIRYHIDNYLKDGDANNFIEHTYLTREKPKSMVEKIKYLVVGDRNHQWMYDGKSLCNLLSSMGFKDPKVIGSGLTNIAEPGALNLHERTPESVFVEAVKN
jgi:predicted SAM-dependent methyltransferase